MKHIEPFSFWPAYASAIPGFGGNDAGPDPFYCFHTPYTEFSPGHVAFHLKLSGARATMGELALRVHAYRTDQSSDAMMVSGTRQRLDNLNGSDMDLSVRFLALPGVGYALFGRYSEPADLSIGAIEIAAEELGNVPGIETGDTAISARADGAFADVNKLCSDRMPSIIHPVSQPCTRDQIESPAFALLWPMIPEHGGDPVVRWSMVVPLQVLHNAGVLRRGAKALLINPPDPALGAVLRDRGCLVVERAGAGASSGEGDCDRDFAVVYAMNAQGAVGDVCGLSPEQSIGLVLKGGLVISVSTIDAEPFMVRNAMQQVALRLIGRGHGMAQICIPADCELVRGEEGRYVTMAVVAMR